MESKKITLGVREFTIPELAIRQNRIVTPLFFKVRPELMRLAKEKQAHTITQEYIDYILEVVYQGVQRGIPTMTKDAFMDFVFTVPDLLTAFWVVCTQAGLVTEKTEATQPGEENGAADPAHPPTGESTSTT